MIYKRQPERLPACTLSNHLMLHIPEIIRYCGPLRQFWCFPVERHCSSLIGKLRSRKHPYTNLTMEIYRMEEVSIS